MLPVTSDSFSADWLTGHTNEEVIRDSLHYFSSLSVAAAELFFGFLPSQLRGTSYSPCSQTAPPVQLSIVFFCKSYRIKFEDGRTLR